MKPIEHYFEVFCPETAEINARCATQNEAVLSAEIYAKEGKEYVIYECKIVQRIPPPSAAGDEMMGFWSDLRQGLSSPYTRGEAFQRESERVATLESALVTIRSSIPGYLKKEMTAEEFALIVIGAADSAMVNKALEKGR